MAILSKFTKLIQSMFPKASHNTCIALARHKRRQQAEGSQTFGPHSFGLLCVSDTDDTDNRSSHMGGVRPTDREHSAGSAFMNQPCAAALPIGPGGGRP